MKSEYWRVTKVRVSSVKVRVFVECGCECEWSDLSVRVRG